MPIKRILVDNGSAVNILPRNMLRTFGRHTSELIHVDVRIAGFNEQVSTVLGRIPLQVTIGDCTSLTTFHVIEVSGTSYAALLGREWIHSNNCVPSTLHQCIMMWYGDQVRMIKADQDPFMTVSNAAQIFPYAYYYARGDVQASMPQVITYDRPISARKASAVSTAEASEQTDDPNG